MPLFNPILKLAKFEQSDIVKAKTDEKLRYKLFNDNIPLFGKILSKWNIFGDEQDDYFQELWIVFDKCIRDFNPSFGGSFTSYVYTAAERAVSRLIKEQNPQQHYDINIENKEDIGEIKDLNVDVKETVNLKDVIERVMSKLDTLSKTIVNYFLEGYNRSEIAEKLDLSKQRVEQIWNGEIKPLFEEYAGDIKLGMETWISENGQYKISSIIVDTWDKLNAVVEQDEMILADENIKIGNKTIKIVSVREAILDKVLIDKIAKIEENIRYGDAKISRIIKVGYVKNCPGHKNSKGENAEWCIVSHETGKILSSHTSKEKAESHLQDMHTHKGTIEIEGVFLNKEGYLIKANGQPLTIEEFKKVAAEEDKIEEEKKETEEKKKEETEEETDEEKKPFDNGKDIAELKLNQKAFNLEDGNIISRFLSDEKLLGNKILIDFGTPDMAEYYEIVDYDDMLNQDEKDKIKLKLNEIFKKKDTSSVEVN